VPAAERIGAELDGTVVNMRFVKPLDEETVLDVARRHAALVTLEDNAVTGGAGTAVLECLQQHGLGLPTVSLGIPDRFIEHGSREDNLASAGLDDASLRAEIARFWLRERPQRPIPAAGS